MVSTGNIANSVTTDLAILADAQLFAVSSRTAENAETFAQQFGFQKSYADRDGIAGYQQMFQDEQIDVVYIGTPHGQHFDVAKVALEAGKHVLAFTINAREAEFLIELARERGLFLMEAMWARFVPGIQRALQIAADGELGTIRWVRADLGFPAPMDRNSRILAPIDGGGRTIRPHGLPFALGLGHVRRTGFSNRERLADRLGCGRTKCADFELPRRRPSSIDEFVGGPMPWHCDGRRQPRLSRIHRLDE